MIRFFKKLFKRGDFMTRADKAYYKYRAKTIFWSAFCMIIIAWVGTNLVLCALTTNVTSNFDMIYEATPPVTLPTGKEFNRILKKTTTFEDGRVDQKIKTITFDKFTDGVEDEYFVNDVNVLEGAAKETVSAENKIYLYRTPDLEDVYVLSPNKMQANPDSSYMFYELSVMSYTFNNFDTSQVQSLNHIFSGGTFTYLTNYTFSTNAAGSKFQTLNTFNSTFYPPIEVLDLSMWDTSNVTDMSYMFYDCNCITKLNLSGWDTKNVTDMSRMFCIYYGSMWWGSTQRLITELDLSSFDTRSVKDMSNMFAYNGSKDDDVLKTIYVSEKFVVDQVEKSELMFFGCTELLGGQGTKCSGGDTSSNWNPKENGTTDKTYARIDGKDGLQGYFTEKA